ncbi:MAG: DNA-directed DNA polymerase II small subunit [Candidatus Undinarchaeales archaeon]|jgi:DNA polymerase II small subunit|nr:DNA-directed DNA polymerase II small subunit [Candidatus Undinarchaeales archaeon]MDP7491702.1 DNA-directed DNA polymerase II small subunit [Candidatus Undinarchaeales archaeon]
MERSKLIECIRDEGYSYNFTPEAVELIVDRDDLDEIVTAVEQYEDIDTITEEIVEALHENRELPDIDWASFLELKARCERGEDEGGFKQMVAELRKVSVPTESVNDSALIEEPSVVEAQSGTTAEAAATAPRLIKEENGPAILIDSTVLTQVPTTSPVATGGAEEGVVVVLGSRPETMIRGDLRTSAQVLMEYRESFDQRGTVDDFMTYFSSRYKKLKKLLEGRPELSSLLSIERAASYNADGEYGREDISVIGMVTEKTVTKNGHIMLTIEDPSGTVRVLILKDKQELMEKGNAIVQDEVIGIRGSPGKDILFCNDLIFPNVHLRNPIPRTEEEVYAVFISDVHVGSNEFRDKEFERFLSWLRGEWGDEKKRQMAARVGYLLIAGDLVDGIGIYKGQDKELTITDIYKQYEVFARYMEMVPEGIQTVIIPGNHDVSREAEPQPAVFNEFARDLYEKDRYIISSNPSLVRLHDTLDVLMYHGASLDSMIDALPQLKDGYNRPSLVMEQLIRKRHLNPIFGHKTRIFPEREDLLVIQPVPHVFHAGHVHTYDHTMYRGIHLINSGTFQGQTEFQVRMGHQPTPSIVPVLNLKTGNIKRLGFAEVNRGGV